MLNKEKRSTFVLSLKTVGPLSRLTWPRCTKWEGRGSVEMRRRDSLPFFERSPCHRYPPTSNPSRRGTSGRQCPLPAGKGRQALHRGEGGGGGRWLGRPSWSMPNPRARATGRRLQPLSAQGSREELSLTTTMKFNGLRASTSSSGTTGVHWAASKMGHVGRPRRTSLRARPESGGVGHKRSRDPKLPFQRCRWR